MFNISCKYLEADIRQYVYILSSLYFNSYRKQPFKMFQCECISIQIWPCCNVGQGQPRIIIWVTLKGP